MKTISKEKAQQFCMHWHNGQWCPLYSFCSTGKLYLPVGYYVQAVEETINSTTVKGQIRELKSLKNFFIHAGRHHLAKNEQVYNASIPDYLIGFFEDGSTEGLSEEEETQAKAYIQALKKDAEKYGDIKYCTFEAINKQSYFRHRNSVNKLASNVFDCLITFHYK